MPTYEYRCGDCGHTFETFQRIDEAPLTVCERCGGKLRKVFHPAGIVFKGSGFYATDSRSKAKTKDGGGSKDDAATKKEPKTAEPAAKKESTGSESGS